MIRKKIVTAIILVIFNCCSFNSQNNVAPKLVVGVVVDQMRNDFIYRYWNRFGEGGFKRLVSNGYYLKNTHYNYIPTYTGPGHSSIYTGATPRTHGIIANDWFVKSNGTNMYCVEDTASRTVGSTSKAGKMSPRNQLSSTIGDELKMSTNQQAKVFGISLKDRSAILPAGHAANGAFWLDDETGNFISSTWYMNNLPQWVIDFNNKKNVENYLKNDWNTLYPIESYTCSIADDNEYEGNPTKKEKSIFPYSYKQELEKKKFGVIKSSPYGNSLVTDLALECIVKEQLGKDNVCDLLAISYSSTDYVQHYFGPRSVETEDTYLRLDKQLEVLLKSLDKEIGKNNYVIFLTADHGGADVPHHLIDQKIPAGYLREKKIIKALKSYLITNYGDSLLLSNVSNEQVFLNEKKINDMKLDKSKFENSICEFLVSINGIAEAYPSQILKNNGFNQADIRTLLQNGYNHQLSGNISFIYYPAWMDNAEKGTTHGAGYNYDTHVPLIFFGEGIKKGQTYKYHTITQIAPTICELMHVNQPNSTFAEPLLQVLK